MIYSLHAQARISAKKEKAHPHPRVSDPHEIARWSKRHKTPQEGWPQASDDLTMPPVILRWKTTKGPSRFIIVVSAKIDKRATKRNRMRRLIRECLRRLVPTGVSATCIVKQNIAHYTYNEMETLLKGLLHEKRRA